MSRTGENALRARADATGATTADELVIYSLKKAADSGNWRYVHIPTAAEARWLLSCVERGDGDGIAEGFLSGFRAAGLLDVMGTQYYLTHTGKELLHSLNAS